MSTITRGNGLPMRGSQYVTITVGGQLFGVPISRVQDVFVPDNLSYVPLARPQIAGVLNLRGRILTTIDLRCALGVAAECAETATRPAVSVIHANESYGLLADSVGEVITLAGDAVEPNPVNLDPAWARISAGTCPLEDELMVVLDVDALIEGLLNRDAA